MLINCLGVVDDDVNACADEAGVNVTCKPTCSELNVLEKDEMCVDADESEFLADVIESLGKTVGDFEYVVNPVAVYCV